MNAELARVLELQEVDLARDALLRERGVLPTSLNVIEQEVAKAKSSLEERRSHLDRVRKERAQREKDLELALYKLNERDTNLRRDVKSNEAYQAALRELEQTRKANSHVEDEILDMMEQVERFMDDISKAEESIRAREEELVRERQRVGAATRELDGRIVSLESQAQALASRVAPDLLSQYRRARTKRGGIGLARAAAGSCLACHMEIPPQMFNELIKGNTEHECPSCHRILYYREDPTPEALPSVQPESGP